MRTRNVSDFYLLFASYSVPHSEVLLWGLPLRSSRCHPRARPSLDLIFSSCVLFALEKKDSKRKSNDSFLPSPQVKKGFDVVVGQERSGEGKVESRKSLDMRAGWGGKLWGTTTTSTTLSKHYNSNKRHYLTWHCHFLRSLASPFLSLSLTAKRRRRKNWNGNSSSCIFHYENFFIETFFVFIFLLCRHRCRSPHPFLASITFHYFLAHSQTSRFSQSVTVRVVIIAVTLIFKFRTIKPRSPSHTDNDDDTSNHRKGERWLSWKWK